MSAPFVIGKTHVLTWSAYMRLDGSRQWSGTWAIYPKVEPYFIQGTVAGDTLEGLFPSELSAERAAFEAGYQQLELLAAGVSA